MHEVAPPRLRSVLGIVTNLGFCMGFLLAQVLGLPEVLGRSGKGEGSLYTCRTEKCIRRETRPSR